MSSEQMAKKIVQWFNDRKGFDDWWDTIDDDMRDEIVLELARKLEELRSRDDEPTA